jgi:hypothetical protein
MGIELHWFITVHLTAILMLMDGRDIPKDRLFFTFQRLRKKRNLNLMNGRGGGETPENKVECMDD